MWLFSGQWDVSESIMWGLQAGPFHPPILHMMPTSTPEPPVPQEPELRFRHRDHHTVPHWQLLSLSVFSIWGRNKLPSSSSHSLPCLVFCSWIKPWYRRFQLFFFCSLFFFSWLIWFFKIIIIYGEYFLYVSYCEYYFQSFCLLFHFVYEFWVYFYCG